MSWRLSTSARNAALNGTGILPVIDAGAGAGTLRVYTGAQPADPNTAVTGTLLATVTLADPAFGAPASGSATLTDPGAVTADAAGTAGWFRIYDSNSNAVLDGTVTTTAVGTGQLQCGTVDWTVGMTVDLTGGTINMPIG